MRVQNRLWWKRFGLYLVTGVYVFLLSVSAMFPRTPLLETKTHAQIAVKIERRVRDPYGETSIGRIERGQFLGRRVLVESGKRILEAGEVWLLSGYLDLFRSPSMLNDFDEDAYWRGKGVDLRFEVTSVGEDARIKEANRWETLPTHFQNAVEEGVRNLSPDAQDLVYRVVTGAQLDETSTSKDAMRSLGLAHLLAASGMHVDILFQGMLSLLAVVGVSRKLANRLIFAILFLFASTIGFPASIFRAASMRLIREVAIARKYRYSSPKALCLSLLLILIARPYALFDVGLQLSYLACVAIEIARRMCALFELERPILKELQFSVWLQLLLAPVVILQFGTLPLVSALANVLVIPLFSPLFAVAVGLLMIRTLTQALPLVPVLASLLQALLTGVEVVFDQLVFLFLKLLEGIRHIPFGNVVISKASDRSVVFWCLIATIAIVVLYARNPLTLSQYRRIGFGMTYGSTWWIKWATPLPALRLAHLKGTARRSLMSLGVFAALFLIARPVTPSSQADVRWKLTMLDVGQGDSLLLETRDKTFLFDTGGKIDWNEMLGASSKETRELRQTAQKRPPNQMEARYLDALQNLGVTSIDAVFLSHADFDHTGNLNALIDRFPDMEIYRSPGRRENRDTPYAKEVKEGGVLRGEDYKIEVVKAGRWRAVDANDHSMVLLVTLGDWRILFTGDMEEGERTLIGDVRVRDIDVLKVAHHGAAATTSDAFLDWVSPEIALIGVGAGNGYGHPHHAVLERLFRAGATVYRTDRMGNVVLSFTDAAVEVGSQKQPRSTELWKEAWFDVSFLSLFAVMLLKSRPARKRDAKAFQILS